MATTYRVRYWKGTDETKFIDQPLKALTSTECASIFEDGAIPYGKLNDGALSVYATEAITAGQLVCITGYNAASGFLSVHLADANHATAQRRYATYISPAAILITATGTVYRNYDLTGINTGTVTTAGDPVYLSETAGGWTATAPTSAASHAQIVGTCLVKDGANGSIRFRFLDSVSVSVGTGALMAGTLSAAAAGRALMADGFFNFATADRAVADLALNTDKLGEAVWADVTLGAEAANVITATIAMRNTDGTANVDARRVIFRIEGELAATYTLSNAGGGATKVGTHGNEPTLVVDLAAGVGTFDITDVATASNVAVLLSSTPCTAVTGAVEPGLVPLANTVLVTFDNA